MKIASINTFYTSQNSGVKVTNHNTSPEVHSIEIPHIKYSKISFGAMNGVKSKKVDIKSEKEKLIRKLNETLVTEAPEPSDSEKLEIILQWYRDRIQKQRSFSERLEKLSTNTYMPSEIRISALFSLKKEFESYLKSKPPFYQKQAKPKIDEKTDLQLINMFKSAITEDNFDLQKVYDNYYSNLKNITTVKQLKQEYPKIVIPRTPAENIAKKLTSGFTKETFEGLDKYIVNADEEGTMEFLHAQIDPILENLAKEYNLDYSYVYLKLAPITYKITLEKYLNIKDQNSMASLPQYKKNNKLPVSENDIKLLVIDYDDFVLSVVKQQYLEGKKLNNIIYQYGNISINAGSLKESSFKFEKVSEKVKSFIKSAKDILCAQRNYSLYTEEDFKNRLNFYTNKPVGNNERILEQIIEFDNCSFAQDDIAPLIKFLQTLDSVHDGNKSIEECIEIVDREKLYPKGTEKLNEIEKQQQALKLKEEQKKALQLQELRDKFDAAINLLYMNDLNGSANICSKYRPESIDADNSEANYIISLITTSLKGNKNPKAAKEKLQKTLTRRDIYNYYKNQNSQNQIFLNAQKFALDKTKSLAPEIIGQYILNAEIIESYPESFEFIDYPEALSKILEKTNKTIAVEYLCKIDEYNDMQPQDKTFLSKILDIFDEKNPLDKIILKSIIEEHYIKTNTSVKTKINGKENETIISTFAAKAKQEIYEKYKFPTCLEYLEGFENALSSFSSEKGNSGIKLITRNNKSLEHKMELKLAGHDDRLFSSNNDYCFDIFSDKGLH